MNPRARVLAVLVMVAFFVGAIYLTYYLTRRQISRADVSLIPPPTASITPTQTESKTKAETKESQGAVTVQLSAGFNLISFGHRFSPSDGKNVFANLSTKDAFFLKQGKWENFFTGGGSIVPGEGYFVRSASGEALKVPVDGTTVSLDERFTFRLTKGWNAIGNPFRAVAWNPEVKVKDQILRIDEAVAKQYLSDAFWYDPIAKKYEVQKKGDTLPAGRGLLIQSGGEVELILVGPGS